MRVRLRCSQPRARRCGTALHRGKALTPRARCLPSQAAQVSPAAASELDVLTTPTPTTGYVLDDARILSKSAAGELTSIAASIEKDTVRARNQAQRLRVASLTWLLSRAGVPRGCGDAAQAAV